MPEGHVIHRLAHQLEEHFREYPVEVSSPQGRFHQEAQQLNGSCLHHAEAVGKHLFLHFDAPVSAHIVHIHLGLIGKFRIGPWHELHGQVRLRLVDHTHTWVADLHGPQWCRLITEEEYHGVIAKLGEDPLHPGAQPDRIWPPLHRSSRSIGALLMDQKFFAGVGNIYRAETLFRLGIHPDLPGKQLSYQQFLDLWHDLVVLMSDGVRQGRIDTVRPEHTPEAMKRPPRKDDHGGEVYVYRRAGQPCWVCGTPIQQRVLQGRNLFWCPHCQEPPH
ncbi:Fpg/Nei family DNA glycosylase [Corynebacterium sp. 3HC-13]|uniref:Fpg/Nei family DNA glycosylase n=1 Tax=Corynebacterium poyangense TaxID=2684405 RepID=UPI001CC961C1|nr:DNA-formamidopyrimidine glycosylase family protein [Corynebacterium poyangense]MBZ8177226.1 Fpg/Nei family DNA glycosylase [Corynebacterium poyangense]